MLVADSISFQGRHNELVPPTSLSVAPGEMLLIVGEPQIGRTAMALMLSGRMKPKSGTVTWNGHSSMNRLRKASAVVDSPNINEPESHLKIRDIVSEDLSLIPSPIWRRPNPKKWMEEHGFSDIAHEWTDAVDPVRMTDMLTQLAAENRQTKLLIVDSPDRHQEDDEGWLRNLEQYAYSRRQFAVVALVGRAPEAWDGPMMYLGDHALALETEDEVSNEQASEETDTTTIVAAQAPLVEDAETTSAPIPAPTTAPAPAEPEPAADDPLIDKSPQEQSETAAQSNELPQEPETDIPAAKPAGEAAGAQELAADTAAEELGTDPEAEKASSQPAKQEAAEKTAEEISKTDHSEPKD